MLDRARRILLDVVDLENFRATSTDPLIRTIRLGVSPTLGAYLLPALVARLHREHPALRVHVREGLPTALASGLATGVHDVILAQLPVTGSAFQNERLFRTRLRTLEIIQNEAPKHPSTATAVIGDDPGELRIDAASPRQRFLEAFRRRSEHASAVTADMRVQMAARRVEEHGTPQAAADAVGGLARENEWYREGEGAERFLLAQPGVAKAPVNKAALDLLVAWHGEPGGNAGDSRQRSRRHKAKSGEGDAPGLDQ